MLSKDNKAQKIARFSERLDAAEAVLVAENAGLTARDLETLRAQMRATEGGGSAQVVKNTLAKRAIESLADGRFNALAPHLKGALVYGTGKDPVSVAKGFSELADNNPKFILLGGVLANQAMMDAAAIKRLAKLPSREQLLAKLMATMQAPIGRFVSTLHAIPASFARALVAVRDASQTRAGAAGGAEAGPENSGDKQ